MGSPDIEKNSSVSRRELIRRKQMIALGDSNNPERLLVPLTLLQSFATRRDKRPHFRERTQWDKRGEVFRETIWDMKDVKDFPSRGDIVPSPDILYVFSGELTITDAGILRLHTDPSSDKANSVEFGRIDDKETIQNIKNLQNLTVAGAMRIDARKGQSGEYVGTLHPEIVVRLDHVLDRLDKVHSNAETFTDRYQVLDMVSQIIDTPGLSATEMALVLQKLQELRERETY